MNENWYAFCLCVCKEINVDNALAIFDLREQKHKPTKYSSEFIQKTISLRRQGMSYKEIGKILGVTTDVANHLCFYYGGGFIKKKSIQKH